ncbi:DUF262 domain-containing protein [Caenimonas koreensis]|uniref:DUF262 domain-containing protein n=1 Tax=Caenimonas koreensis TaxID=367474 RepID=UPI00378454B7
MTDVLSRTSNAISVASFWELFKSGKFNFDPPFQRKSIWDPVRRGFFIDSLLRNYPIPPVFLHQHIDTETGATSFDVVDGKQRLQSIAMFISNELLVVNESERDIDAPFVGKRFSEFDSVELVEFKKKFWRYLVPVEYLDTDDEQVMNEVFDRLNRNGVPLSAQELRNAQFHGTRFATMVRELAANEFWRQILDPITDKKRFENEEFVADLCFVLWQGGVTNSEGQGFEVQYRSAVDEFDDDFKVDTLSAVFVVLTEWLSSLSLDVDALGIRGASHLYGLWSLAVHFSSLEQSIQPDRNTVGSRLQEFFGKARSAATEDPMKTYFSATNSRTRSRAQRRRRLQALCDAVGVPGPTWT